MSDANDILRQATQSTLALSEMGMVTTEDADGLVAAIREEVERHLEPIDGGWQLDLYSMIVGGVLTGVLYELLLFKPKTGEYSELIEAPPEG